MQTTIIMGLYRDYIGFRVMVLGDGVYRKAWEVKKGNSRARRNVSTAVSLLITVVRPMVGLFIC